MSPVWRIPALKTAGQLRNIAFKGIIFPQRAHRSQLPRQQAAAGQNGTPREHRQRVAELSRSGK
jgi:hypothetical protein